MSTFFNIDKEQLFETALGIKKPWKIVPLKFDSIARKLDINVDFERGASFEYEDPPGIQGFYKAYDTIDKRWRHLNFFEYECYINARTPRIKPGSGGVKIMPPWNHTRQVKEKTVIASPC